MTEDEATRELQRLRIRLALEAARLAREGGYSMCVDEKGIPLHDPQAAILSTAAENVLGDHYEWKLLESLGSPPRVVIGRRLR